MTTRESAFAALFAKLQTATWGSGQTWAYSSRRVALFNQTPNQPALYLVAHDELIKQRTGGDYVQTWKATALIYHQAGAVETAIPNQLDNAILDAIFALFAPDNGFTNKFTLGGLVHHCFIEGQIRKIGGDLDGQAMIVVPITMLIP